ncbi:MAG: glycosyltransferase family 9 protein, partial [Acidobacteriaceae bacterium]|nr:glycosyltransferase family 9 protein [Acidobacteriaceae bacterium]
MSLLDQLPQDARVCIIRLRSLGDCVLTTPAIELLKRCRPDLRVGVVVEERFAPVLAGHPLIASLIPPTWKDVRKWGPTLCVNFHGSSRTQWITALSGAKWRAGFAHHNITLAYNLRIGRAQRIMGVNRTVHTAEHLASAFFAMGVPLQDVPRASLHAGESLICGRYAVLHPFASAPEKRWPAEKFCEVARYLRLWNISPIFLAGAGDDVSPFTAHRVLQGSIETAKAAMSKAVVFVGNDSGPAHIAAAFGVPSIVLFSTSNPAIWGPWRTESEVMVAPDGLHKVSVSRVVAAIER